MRKKINGKVATVMIVALAAADSFAQDYFDESQIKELEEVSIVAKRSEIREMREAAMPVSVVSVKQLEGTTTNINDALARTTGVTVRNTGGVGSASRISVRGLEAKEWEYISTKLRWGSLVIICRSTMCLLMVVNKELMLPTLITGLGILCRNSISTIC